LKADLEAMNQKHILELGNAVQEREVLSSKHASELESARAELETTREAHGKELETLNREHSGHIEKVKGSHSDEVAKLQEINRNEFETLKRQHSEELDLLKGHHNREFSELKAAHLTEFEQLKEEHAALLDKMKKDLDDVHKGYKSSDSEREVEHTRAVDTVTSELAALKAAYHTNLDDLAAVKDSLAAAGETIKELTVRNSDLELKLVTGAESARIAVAELDSKLSTLSIELSEAREKVVALEKENKFEREKHLKESAQSEHGLHTARSEIASLREKLAV